MTCACLYVGPSFLLIYWSCPLALPLGLPCLRGLPLWVWLGLFGSLPPWFPFCGVGWFFAGLFAPLVWSGCLLSVFMTSFRGGLLLLLPWLPPRSALSIWGQFRSKFTRFPNLPHIFCQAAMDVEDMRRKRLFSRWASSRWTPSRPGVKNN